MNLYHMLLGLQIWLEIISLTSSNAGSSAGPEKCPEAGTCSECMTAHYTCMWCKDEDYTESRCQSNSTTPESGFPVCQNWTFPVSSTEETAQDFNDTVQVKPSRIKISNLRPGEEKNISITVKSSRDFPLDVYYLMDFSNSMKDDLEELKSLSADIVDSLTNISANFGIGFGTFVDKPTFPFANTEPGKLEVPCSKDRDHCQAVHSFNHEMSITAGQQAKDHFTDRLNSVYISSNIDAPEGGFDAIVQAAVCSKIIGWRKVARRVIFFASDAVSHMAGDGRLAGIIRPNRLECGMDVRNKYTQSLSEDYPSIGQLNKVLIDRQIIPIFAVTDTVYRHYQDLSESLTQLSSVGKLSDNSGDVVNLIMERLEDIVKKTQLNPETPPDSPLRVTVVPHCVGDQEEMENGCSNVAMEEEVSFSIVVKVEQCVQGGNNTYDFNIEIPGISKIPLSISMTCDCPCEKEISQNSSSCLGSGDLVCGQCQCHKAGGWDPVCTDGADCGEGRCVCGTCDCLDPWYGDNCECSDLTCPSGDDGSLCSGNGNCTCGTCQCDQHDGVDLFTGPDCSCTVSKEGCMQDMLECSGPEHGQCVCGECQCQAGQYSGKYCDICPDCGPLNCGIYRDCVTCYHGNGGEDKECDCPGTAILSEGPTVNIAALQGRYKPCPPILYPLDVSCEINFYIQYTDYGDTKQRTLDLILIDRVLDCPAPPNIVAIVGGGVGGILAIGIFLLALWKIYATVVDKREYKKFLDERSTASWNSIVSPVYKNPTTKYSNPLYTAALDEH